MMDKVVKNIAKMLYTSLLPYKPLLDKAGIEVKEYDEADDETQTVIIGIKLIFHNPEVYMKFKGEKT